MCEFGGVFIVGAIWSCCGGLCVAFVVCGCYEFGQVCCLSLCVDVSFVFVCCVRFIGYVFCVWHRKGACVVCECVFPWVLCCVWGVDLM